MKDEDETEDQLTDELIELRQQVAELEASETDRKRAGEALAQQARELARSNAFITGLGHVAARIEITPDPDQVMETLGTELEKLGITCIVGMLEPDDQAMVVRYTSMEQALLAAGEKLIGLKMYGFRIMCEHFPIWAELVEQKHAVFVTDAVLLLAAVLPGITRSVVEHLFHLGGWVSGVQVIWLPLMAGERVTGGLGMWGPDLRQEDIPALLVFASQVGFALENARLYTQAQREIAERKQVGEVLRQRTAQLEALRGVALELTAQLDLDTLLRSIVSRAAELLGGASGGLYLYRPERDVLEWAVAIGPNLAPTGTVLHRGEGLSGRVWETGEPLIVDDYQHWEGKPAFYESYPWTAVLGVPVRWGEEFLGVLDVLADTPRAFSPADADLLSLFANQAAIAIRNAHLFQAEREQRELAEALEEAAAVVSGTLDLDQVLDRILEQVDRVVAGDAFSVLLIEDDVARLARWRGYELPGEEIQPLRFDIPIAQYPNLREMAQTGKPVVVPDTLVNSDWVPAARDQGWRRSYVGVPIQVGGVTVGFLNVSGTRPGQFGSDDAQCLQAFASHAATAIENARLYGKARQELAERKRAEEALRESEGRYRSLTDDVIDTSVVGIFIFDKDFRVVWVNRALEQFFGLRRDKVIGRDKRQLISERIKDIFEDPESFAEKVLATYDNNTYIESFECHVLPDGEREERWLEHWSQPIRSGLYAGGRIEHYTDITERKQAEEEREKLILELQNALAQVKTLSGLLPICAHCKKIRDDEGYWNQLETYIQEHSEAEFTHGVCGECLKKLYPELFGDDEQKER